MKRNPNVLKETEEAVSIQSQKAGGPHFPKPFGPYLINGKKLVFSLGNLGRVSSKRKHIRNVVQQKYLILKDLKPDSTQTNRLVCILVHA